MLLRGFGCIIYDIGRKYKDINVSDLRKLEKLHIKRNKTQLGINFLINCKTCVVFPNFYALAFGILMSMTLHV